MNPRKACPELSPRRMLELAIKCVDEKARKNKDYPPKYYPKQVQLYIDCMKTIRFLSALEPHADELAEIAHGQARLDLREK